MELQTAIIGAGLIGLSCADSLIRRGVKVSVFEASKRVGLGAEQYNSGMIHPSQAITPTILKSHSEKSARRLIDLAEQSRDLLQKRRALLKCPDISRPAGTIQFFDTEESQKTLAELYEKMGIPAMLYRGPWTAEKPAFSFPTDVSGNAGHYTALLSEDIKKRGGVFNFGKVAKPAVEDGQITGVYVGNEFRAADQVIIACGAKTPGMLAPFGLKIPIKPVRGHAIVFGRPDRDLPPVPIMHYESHSALTVFEDHVRISGSLNEDEPHILYEIWEQLNPELVHGLGTPLLHWSADRPVSHLGRPIIAKTPIDGLYVNSGHGHMGWSLCTASGELMADIITEDLFLPEYYLPPPFKD